jgi:hypothetical protein
MAELDAWLDTTFNQRLPLPPQDFKSAALVYYYSVGSPKFARPDCSRGGDLGWVKAQFKTRVPINLPFNEIEAFLGRFFFAIDDFVFTEYVCVFPLDLHYCMPL